MIGLQRCFIKCNCSLTTLYNDDRYTIAYKAIDDYYENVLKSVLKEADINAPYLIEPYNHFAFDIQKYFIEEGENLNSYEDLEILLKKLNCIQIKNFKLEKHNYMISEYGQN